MHRSILIIVLVVALQWSSAANASNSPTQLSGTTLLMAGTPVAQHPTAFLVSGFLGTPIITLGFARLGRLIDEKSAGTDEPVGSSFERLGLVVGLGATFVGFKGLGAATNIPVSWSSAAAGMGLGLGVGLTFLGIDAGLMALFKLKPTGTAAGLLSLATVVAWSISTAIFVKWDPFKLASPGSNTGQASVPLMAMSF
jgi:hypothetical protein